MKVSFVVSKGSVFILFYFFFKELALVLLCTGVTILVKNGGFCLDAARILGKFLHRPFSPIFFITSSYSPLRQITGVLSVARYGAGLLSLPGTVLNQNFS